VLERDCRFRETFFAMKTPNPPRRSRATTNPEPPAQPRFLVWCAVKKHLEAPGQWLFEEFELALPAIPQPGQHFEVELACGKFVVRCHATLLHPEGRYAATAFASIAGEPEDWQIRTRQYTP
jgi:hypothetical protein